MPNMSYCRFENTYADLLDCYEELKDKPLNVLSKREIGFAKRLIGLCNLISMEIEFSEYIPIDVKDNYEKKE